MGHADRSGRGYLVTGTGQVVHRVATSSPIAPPVLFPTHHIARNWPSGTIRAESYDKRLGRLGPTVNSRTLAAQMVHTAERFAECRSPDPDPECSLGPAPNRRPPTSRVPPTFPDRAACAPGACRWQQLRPGRSGEPGDKAPFEMRDWAQRRERPTAPAADEVSIFSSIETNPIPRSSNTPSGLSRCCTQHHGPPPPVAPDSRRDGAGETLIASNAGRRLRPSDFDYLEGANSIPEPGIH